MEIVSKKLSELHPYENNPRKNDDAVKYVAESIKRFGFKVPLVIDKEGTIVCGHTRYKASKKLGIKEVPCVIADDLTEEQIKAFRLADNKVAEKSEWDFDILNDEINDIMAFDMEDFGFEFIDETENKANVQEKAEDILNLGKGQYAGEGIYDIPILQPIHQNELGEIKEWIGFNYVLSDPDPKGKAVHFFLDDYQFERLWNNPNKYLDKLRQYEAVLSPDFSPYGDMPMALQIFNHYRKHWVGRYLQEHGVKVIPTIRASTNPMSLEWYLEGEPEGGVVCISSMWTGGKEAREYFKEKEYKTMLARLHPEKIFVYGNPVEGLEGDIEYIQSYTRKRFGS